MIKVLHIGFGYPPFWPGGMVSYQLDMMKELQNLGYNVSFFTAGRYDFKKKAYLYFRKIRSIPVIEIVNSPNPYNPYCFRSDPLDHCQNTEIELFTKLVIEREEPEIVHLHDLRMHCASVIKVIKAYNIPIIKTIHNYWDLCSNNSLYYKEETPCEDYKNGRRCIDCLGIYPDSSISVKIRLKGTVRGESVLNIVRPMLRIIRRVPLLKQERRDNYVIPVKFPAQLYQYRRNFFINCLRMCDIIHTTSHYCAEKFIKYGMNKEAIRVVSLSSSSLTYIKPKFPQSSKYPICFGYRGAIIRIKGINVLLEAFSQLNQSKCKLIIYGYGDRELIKILNKSALNIEFRGTYKFNKMQESLQEIDVGIVPSLWEEPFGITGLEFLEARIPVIASRTGGISEWLHDGENGFLFSPGNVAELKRLMQKFIDEPDLIRKLSLKIKPWKSMAAHAQEISHLYNNLLDKKRKVHSFL